MRRNPSAGAVAIVLLAAGAPACAPGAAGPSGIAEDSAPGATAADVLPAERRTTWRPGIPGGIPTRTGVCASLDAGRFGEGSRDATGAIQSAIDGCPDGQVVALGPGEFRVDGEHPLTIRKGIVLRGAGRSRTRLVRTGGSANPIVLIGERWPREAASVRLSADAAKGALAVRVARTAGFAPGQLALIDEPPDPSFVYWGRDPAAAPGGPARGWFTRYDRPVGQMVEIASVSGDTVSLTAPLHIAFRTARGAELTRFEVPFGARRAGIEDLQVRGGGDDNLTLRLAVESWVSNVESVDSTGDSIGLDNCLRCVVRDSDVHHTTSPYPGGAGYLLSIASYTADSLVENNAFVNGNKVMVMRASGGGNVIAYNYFDDGHIASYPGWMETGLNASHLACPHFELFEGNEAFNIDGDDTWGGSAFNTFFRNHATGERRSFGDVDNRRAIGLMYGHYFTSFVGNVLGTPGQRADPYHGFAYEDAWPWEDDPVGLWRLGYTPTDWAAPPDPRVVATTLRHGNFDFATRSVVWAPGLSRELPASLYLDGRPAFFGSRRWPWVEPADAQPLHVLPARARYDAGLTAAAADRGSAPSRPR